MLAYIPERCVFRTQSNDCVRTFFSKTVKGVVEKKGSLLSLKRFIIDVQHMNTVQSTFLSVLIIYAIDYKNLRKKEELILIKLFDSDKI